MKTKLYIFLVLTILFGFLAHGLSVLAAEPEPKQLYEMDINLNQPWRVGGVKVAHVNFFSHAQWQTIGWDARFSSAGHSRFIDKAGWSWGGHCTEKMGASPWGDVAERKTCDYLNSPGGVHQYRAVIVVTIYGQNPLTYDVRPSLTLVY